MSYLSIIRQSFTRSFSNTVDFIRTHKLALSLMFIVLGGFTAIFASEVDNWAFYVRFMNGLIVLIIYVFLLFIKQYRETLVPWDFYTRLRIYILTLIAVSILTLAPSVIYQAVVAFGGNSSFLRNFISIIGGINLTATTILLLLVFYYRVRK